MTNEVKTIGTCSVRPMSEVSRAKRPRIYAAVVLLADGQWSVIDDATENKLECMKETWADELCQPGAGIVVIPGEEESNGV